MTDAPRRQLAAIMFADMVGYTALMQSDEEGAHAQRQRHRSILSECVERHHGQILQHYGDGSLTIFASAVEAVECAVEAQRLVSREPLVPLRIGVHSGDIVHEGESVYGDGVNVASRIEGISAPGGVMVSAKVFDEIKNHPTIKAVPMGPVRLKNVGSLMNVFAISVEGIAVPSKEDVAAKGGVAADVAPAGRGEGAGGEMGVAQGTPLGVGEIFLQRVRERALIQWALVYLAGAWAVWSIVRFAGEGANWPPAVARAVDVSLFMGFLVAMVVAWFHGEKGRQPVRRAEVLLIAALVAVGGWALSRVSSSEEALPSSQVAAAVDDRPSVAALPWVNRSGRPEDAYFVDGIHDEILTRLSKIGGLRVISRQSVMQFRDSPKGTREIASELGVRYILEAGLLRVRDTVRINVQLIDAQEDHVAWAVSQDRYLTLENLLAIQTEIAQVIADTLRAQVTPDERAELGRASTNDLQAYDFFLEGRGYYLRPGYLRNNYEAAQTLLEEAIQRDPQFALAYATLSLVHGALYWEGYDRSEERLASQRDAAEEALRLDPDLPQAHQALGRVDYVSGDFEGALEHYQTALLGLPNDAELIAAVGYAQRRLKNWPEVFAAFDKAVRLNPREATLHYDLGGHSFSARRRYREAMREYNAALGLAPDLYDAGLLKGYIWLHWRGSLDTLRAMVAALPPELHTPGVDVARLDLSFLQRDTPTLLSLLARDPEDTFETQLVFRPKPLYTAWAHVLEGEAREARAAFDSARAQLEGALGQRPDDPRVLAALGFTYAGLGRTDDAARAAEQALEANERGARVLTPAQTTETSARILAQAGLAEESVDRLEALLTGDSPVSAHTLSVDPFFDPIRDSPAFQALLERYRPEDPDDSPR